MTVYDFYTITIAVGPHQEARDFVGELIDLVANHIDDTDIEGVPVTYGCEPSIWEDGDE